MKLAIIAAVAENNVIGYKNSLIWRISEDLKRFKRLTTGHHIIMGRKTFESIGRPLPNRVSVIITRQQNYEVVGCVVVHSLQEALKVSSTDSEAFIIGGGEIYREAMEFADKLYLTHLHKKFHGDCFFPYFDESEWRVISRERHCLKSDTDSYDYSFVDYVRESE